MINILITGGCGFIGSNLARRLVSDGYTVTVLDNLSRQIHGEDPEYTSPLYNSVKHIASFIQGSVTDREVFWKALDRQNVVVHLAAETGTGQSMYEIQRYCDVNIGGTAILLDYLANKEHSIDKVVVASSRSIYGEGKYRSEKYGIVYPTARSSERMDKGDFRIWYNDDPDLELLPTDEDSKIHPSSIYGITKQNQEQMILTLCRSLGIDSVALRYQNVYGPGQSLTNPYTGILSIFSTLIREGKAINVFEDGAESRDFVFIDDVVKATVQAIELTETTGIAINIGSGVGTSVLNVAQTLTSYYAKEVAINVTGNYRLGDIRHNIADLTRAKAILGYEPTVGFEEGLSSFTEWVKQQELHSNNYENSILEMKARGLLK